MKSRFTHVQSQAITTIEVIVLLTLGLALWFNDYRMWAVVMLIWATLSLLAHFNRQYKGHE